MNRREALLRGVGATVLAVSAKALGGAQSATPKASGSSQGKPNQALIDAAYTCEKDGEICLEHCLDRLAEKDNTLAECARSVQEMLVACRAISSLAIQKSPRVKEMASLCAKICRDCEAACHKHASQHEDCRRCEASCKACAAECDKAT
jgi:Cys-rich four helix bundle protein (predicted Tat secretion target)